jgi:peptidoglycan/xylan/chitin deacetylase (PgdA/CDA1 family)
MPKIQFKRGLEANLPILNEGEPAFTTDTKRVFVGSSSGNVELAKQTNLDTTNANVASNTSTLATLATVNPNAELLSARGTFPLVGDRIASAESNLASNTSQLIKKSQQLNKGILQASRNTQTTIPLTLFVDDDGNTGVITKLKDLFRSRGVPCSVALIGNSPVVTNEDYRNQLLDLQNNDGWEILSHTMAHINLSTSTNEQQEQDCIDYLNLMNGYGFNVKSIAYPWGQYGNKDIISKYFEAGFDTANTYNNAALDPYKIHRYALGSSMPAGEDTLAFFQGVIDGAIANKRLIVFMTHCDYPGNDMQIITDVLDYAITQGLKIGTPNEALRYFAPIIYSGDMTNGSFYAVRQNGKIQTNRYHLQHNISLETITNATEPSYFAEGVSSRVFTTPQSTGFPTSNGGTLIVNKILNQYSYAHQLWYPTDRDYFYIRRANDDTTWKAWKRNLIESDKTHSLLATDSVTEASLPSAFPLGESLGLVTGWSLGNGTLKMYNVGASGFERQEFWKSGSRTVYSRTFNGASWSTWVDVSAIWSNGATGSRPTIPLVGQRYFDVTIGKPIWCKTAAPVAWVDATGTTV